MSHNTRILQTKNNNSLTRIMEQIGVHPEGINRMLPKAKHFLIHLEKVNHKAAHILKQEILSLGGDAALSQGISSFTDTESDILLMGTKKQVLNLVTKLKIQPFGSGKIAKELEQVLLDSESDARMFSCRNHTFNLSLSKLVMGILNITPDSFSDGNKYLEPEQAVERAIEMVEEGADIIDIGGESTRPGAVTIDTNQELERILPVLKTLARRTSIPISVDTYKKEVAQVALDNGACIINDISGLRKSPEIASLVAEYDGAIVIMHMLGTPQNMHVNANIISFLRKQVDFAENEGVASDHIAIDPGIGFGKTVKHNLEILNNIAEYRSLGKTVLLGPSRKSFIGKILELEIPDRLAGTSAVTIISAYLGVDILRVHDILFTKQGLQMVDAIKNPFSQKIRNV